MSMAVGGTSGPKSDINMTPMIDVLLVLIIIFMVITPLTPKGLEALVPQPPPPGMHQDAADIRTVVISINEDHSMLINQDPIEESALQNRLVDIFKTRAERVVFVKGDPNLEFSWVAKVIDIAHGAQIDKVGLMPYKDLTDNRRSNNAMRKLTIVLAAVALALVATSCNKLKIALSGQRGRAGLQGRPVSAGRRALQACGGPGSDVSLGARVPGRRLLPAIHSGRHVAGKRRRWRMPPTTSFRRFSSRTRRTNWRLCPSPACS